MYNNSNFEENNNSFNRIQQNNDLNNLNNFIMNYICYSLYLIQISKFYFYYKFYLKNILMFISYGDNYYHITIYRANNINNNYYINFRSMNNNIDHFNFDKSNFISKDSRLINHNPFKSTCSSGIII